MHASGQTTALIRRGIAVGLAPKIWRSQNLAAETRLIFSSCARLSQALLALGRGTQFARGPGGLRYGLDVLERLARQLGRKRVRVP
jgi:hypothetical protein